MITIEPQQFRQRLRLISQKLQDAIFAPQTADLVGRIGEKNHLTKEKISTVGEVVGLVLGGFVHIEDMNQEIAEKAALPKELAATIGGELLVKLIGPLRADIEKAYSPEEKEEETVERKPILVSDTKGESETTGLYPRPFEPIAPPSTKFFTSKPPSSFEAQKENKTEVANQKFSPLTYGEKSTKSEESVKTPAPKIIHEESSVLPVSNIPRLGLGLADDKLGSIGNDKGGEGPVAKFEVSGLSKEQLDRIEREPLPSFMKREIPPPRVVNYKPPSTNLNQSSSQPTTSPNFPIGLTPKISVSNPGSKVEKVLPPLPGIPTSSPRPQPPAILNKQSSDKQDIKEEVQAPQKSWFGWGGPKIKEKAIVSEGGEKIVPATPIQVYQAKKVDYKESVSPAVASSVTSSDKTVVSSRSSLVPPAPFPKKEPLVSTPMASSPKTKEIEMKAEKKMDQVPTAAPSPEKLVAEIKKEAVPVLPNNQKPTPKKSLWSRLFSSAPKTEKNKEELKNPAVPFVATTSVPEKKILPSPMNDIKNPPAKSSTVPPPPSVPPQA